MFTSLKIGRAGVFIDESNLFHSQKTLGWRVDYKKLYWLMRDLNLELRNIFIYTSFVKENGNQRKFIDKLVEYGYFVHYKEVKEIKIGGQQILKKGNLDIELALDAFQYKDLFDTLVLFSGDSDFAYLIDLLKGFNKKTIVVSSRKNISRELLKRSFFIDIKKLKSEIEYIPQILKTSHKGEVLDGTTPTIIPK